VNYFGSWYRPLSESYKYLIKPLDSLKRKNFLISITTELSDFPKQSVHKKVISHEELLYYKLHTAKHGVASMLQLCSFRIGITLNTPPTSEKNYVENFIVL
jgi:hypothetical protein